MRRIAVRRGMDIKLTGAPSEATAEILPVGSVGLLGGDFPGIRPHFEVDVGDEVARGQTLFIDRKRPEIRFTSPASGTVASITRGARRMLEAIVVKTSGNRIIQFDRGVSGDAEATRRLLLQSGLWTGFRTRPFERIPDPDAVPAAIFVTAIDTAPLAADPAAIISAAGGAFRGGIAALRLLTAGPVFVCQSPGEPLVDETDQVNVVAFTGPHPAGLPGTHIHHLMPASPSRTVWHIGYADVIAIGHLFITGETPGERTVAITGSAARRPRLVRVPPGSDLDELVTSEVEPGAATLSGSILHGRDSRFLGRYHTQVTAPSAQSKRPHRLSGAWQLLLRLRPSDAIVPVTTYDRVLPFDILPVPLLRALSVGDVETAERLGCLELAEDDLALLSHICPTQGDYGPLLRRVLDEIGGAA